MARKISPRTFLKQSKAVPKMGKSSGNHPVSLSSNSHPSDASPVRSKCGTNKHPRSSWWTLTLNNLHGTPWESRLSSSQKTPPQLVENRLPIWGQCAINHRIRSWCSEENPYWFWCFFLEWEFPEGLEKPALWSIFYHVVRFNYINVTIIV